MQFSDNIQDIEAQIAELQEHRLKLLSSTVGVNSGPVQVSIPKPYSVFDEYIPTKLWDLVKDFIVVISCDSCPAQGDDCPVYQETDYMRNNFEFRCHDDPNLYSTYCYYDTYRVGKYHDCVMIDGIVFKKTSPDGTVTNLFPMILSRDRSIRALHGDVIYVDSDGERLMTYPWGDNEDEDLDCHCGECHQIIEVENCSVCKLKYDEDDIDMNDYKGFKYGERWNGYFKDEESKDYVKMMECNDIVQHESNKMDFEYNGCKSVSYLEEVISNLPPYQAVQLILSYAKKRIIDSGK